jgi:hypothetical protein
MLDLLVAVVGDAPGTSVYGLSKALQRISVHAPHKKFQKLITFASNI